MIHVVGHMSHGILHGIAIDFRRSIKFSSTHKSTKNIILNAAECLKVGILVGISTDLIGKGEKNNFPAQGEIYV
jgi:hypothetical protein